MWSYSFPPVLDSTVVVSCHMSHLLPRTNNVYLICSTTFSPLSLTARWRHAEPLTNLVLVLGETRLSISGILKHFLYPMSNLSIETWSVFMMFSFTTQKRHFPNEIAIKNWAQLFLIWPELFTCFVSVHFVLVSSI